VVRRFAADPDAPTAYSLATAAAPNRTSGFSATLCEGPIGPGDLPVRAGIACDGETPHTVSLAVSHMAVDGWSRGILIEDLAALLAGAEPPPVAEQPVDRAAYEASPEGRLVQRRALEHWRITLQRLPESYFEAAGDFAGSADSATITSPAAARARPIRARTWRRCGPGRCWSGPDGISGRRGTRCTATSARRWNRPWWWT
jgi:hypothetical protein